MERKRANKRACGGGEEGDEDEEEEQQDSPYGPAVVLEEPWLGVGEEEVGLTGG